jgi:hypothetical protein
MKHFATASSILLLLALGLAAGYFLGQRSPENANARQEALEAEALDQVVQALNAWTAAAELLGEVAAVKPPSESPALTSEAVAALAASLASMEASLASTSKSLESVARTLARSNVPSALLNLPKGPVSDEVFAHLKAASDVDRQLGHHRWGHQQVVDTYGVPSRIVVEREGSVERWYFKRPGLGEFIFQFSEDHLDHVMVP